MEGRLLFSAPIFGAVRRSIRGYYQAAGKHCPGFQLRLPQSCSVKQKMNAPSTKVFYQLPESNNVVPPPPHSALSWRETPGRTPFPKSTRNLGNYRAIFMTTANEGAGDINFFFHFGWAHPRVVWDSPLWWRRVQSPPPKVKGDTNSLTPSFYRTLWDSN